MPKDMNKLVTFLPVSDVDDYCEWDDDTGYCGTEHLPVEGGILVLVKNAEGMQKHVDQYEEVKKHYDNS